MRTKTSGAHPGILFKLSHPCAALIIGTTIERHLGDERMRLAHASFLLERPACWIFTTVNRGK